MKTISDKIFELLKEKGMSQKEFAQRTGIAESSIQYGLAQIDRQEYLEVMEHAIAQKDRTLNETDPYKRRMKLMRFAASRGFELGDIHNFLPED